MKFEEEQLVSYLRRPLFDALLQVSIRRTRGIGGIEEAGITSNATQGFIERFQFLKRVEHNSGRKSLRLFHWSSEPLFECFGACVTFRERGFDARIVMCCKKIVQIPSDSFRAIGSH